MAVQQHLDEGKKKSSWLIDRFRKLATVPKGTKLVDEDVERTWDQKCDLMEEKIDKAFVSALDQLLIDSIEIEDIKNDMIRQLAYEKWEAAGRPEGDGVQFWLEAEAEYVG